MTYKRVSRESAVIGIYVRLCKPVRRQCTIFSSVSFGLSLPHSSEKPKELVVVVILVLVAAVSCDARGLPLKFPLLGTSMPPTENPKYCVVWYLAAASRRIV